MSMDHAKTQRSGTQKTPLWIEEPTAMPSASSILFLTAKMMAAACSAALPTMGMMMVPRKRSGTPQPTAASSESTMYSERIEMTTVMTASQKTEPATPSTASSSSSSPSPASSSSSYRNVCVTS